MVPYHAAFTLIISRSRTNLRHFKHSYSSCCHARSTPVSLPILHQRQEHVLAFPRLIKVIATSFTNCPGTPSRPSFHLPRSPSTLRLAYPCPWSRFFVISTSSSPADSKRCPADVREYTSIHCQYFLHFRFIFILTYFYISHFNCLICIQS